MINNRLYPLLTKLIRDDQNGFIKGRNIGDNIRLMFNVIDYANNEDRSGALLSVDLYKAFDSLRWPFIFAMLRQYGFGNLLIEWIKVLHKNPKCRIINNNFLSPFFQVNNGVRQGDPLSPTIFVLCIEYLAIMLRQSTLYHGLQIGTELLKVSLFANDTVIYLNDSPSQFKCVFTILENFGSKSGCKVSLNKSCAFYSGKSKKNKIKPYLDKGLVWPANFIKYLGTNILLMQYDDLSLYKKIFGTTIDEMKAILNIWSSRSLTLLGKITVLKTLIVPKIIYKVSHLPIFLPDSFVNELNQILFRFIWGSKWEKISRLKLCCNIKEGGANMIDIKCHMLSIKLKWIQKLFDSIYVGAWKYIEKICLKENFFFCIVRSNLKMNNMLIKKLVV